jgi:hypothetical protein
MEGEPSSLILSRNCPHRDLQLIKTLLNMLQNHDKPITIRAAAIPPGRMPPHAPTYRVAQPPQSTPPGPPISPPNIPGVCPNFAPTQYPAPPTNCQNCDCDSSRRTKANLPPWAPSLPPAISTYGDLPLGRVDSICFPQQAPQMGGQNQGYIRPGGGPMQYQQMVGGPLPQQYFPGGLVATTSYPPVFVPGATRYPVFDPSNHGRMPPGPNPGQGYPLAMSAPQIPSGGWAVHPTVSPPPIPVGAPNSNVDHLSQMMQSCRLETQQRLTQQRSSSPVMPDTPPASPSETLHDVISALAPLARQVSADTRPFDTCALILPRLIREFCLPTEKWSLSICCHESCSPFCRR